MKSSIKIALGENNSPVINFNIIPSDDLRDQLCCQFLHRLERHSTLCSISIQGNDELCSPITHMLEISPLPPNSHYLCHQRVENMYYHLKGMYGQGSQVMMITSGESIWFENNGTGTVSNKLDREQLRILTIPTLYGLVQDAFERVVDVEKEKPGFITKEYKVSEGVDTVHMKIPEPGQLPSRYQIDDMVSTEDIFDGQVVGVRFTIGKVHYDILDRLSGTVVRDIDSCAISAEPVKLSQAI